MFGAYHVPFLHGGPPAASPRRSNSPPNSTARRQNGRTGFLCLQVGNVYRCQAFMTKPLLLNQSAIREAICTVGKCSEVVYRHVTLFIKGGCQIILNTT